MVLVSVYIFDDRYGVPTWRTVDLRPEDASAFARSLLASCQHYRRVELRLDDALIAMADRREFAPAARVEGGVVLLASAQKA